MIEASIPGISAAHAQDLEIPVEPPWYGVRQHSLEELRASLEELARVYALRSDLRRFCRTQVIAAKERARGAAINQRVSAEKRRIKAEMLDWMLVWLGDPALFTSWIGLRWTSVHRQR
jgi:hypothetical protein